MLRRFWLSTALLTATVMQVLDITETREGASIHQRDQDRRPRRHCDQCGDGTYKNLEAIGGAMRRGG